MGAHGVESAEDNKAIVATELTKWFGEGDTKVIAVNGVHLVAHLGEVEGDRRERRSPCRSLWRGAFHCRAIGKRQDHASQHDFRHPSSECRERDSQGIQYLDP